VLNFIKMINVISIFLCVCKFILVVAQSGTDHCQLAAGQNAHSRNVLFFSRTFSDLISVGGFRNEKKNAKSSRMLSQMKGVCIGQPGRKNRAVRLGAVALGWPSGPDFRALPSAPGPSCLAF